METLQSNASHVLLIDDDEELTELVTEYLRREGFQADVANNGESGTRQALAGDYAVVVLDVMLPGIGGFEVLRRIRAADGPIAQLPILMLTARGDEVDRVLGLELGADDYLPKPFSSRELVARIRAISRRAQNAEAARQTPEASRQSLRVGDVEINPATREVLIQEKLLDLTAAEFDLLEVLLRSAGEIVTRDAIAKAALGRSLSPYDRSIDVHISNLRRKLGASPSGSERIKAVRGVGYLYAHAE